MDDDQKVVTFTNQLIERLGVDVEVVGGPEAVLRAISDALVVSGLSLASYQAEA